MNPRSRSSVGLLKLSSRFFHFDMEMVKEEKRKEINCYNKFQLVGRSNKANGMIGRERCELVRNGGVTVSNGEYDF